MVTTYVKAGRSTEDVNAAFQKFQGEFLVKLKVE